MLFVLLNSTKKPKLNISNFSFIFPDSKNLCTFILSLSSNGLQDHFRFFIFFKIFSDVTVTHYIHLIRPTWLFCNSRLLWKLWWWIRWIVFLIWLTNTRYLTFFPARTFCQRSSPSQAGFELAQNPRSSALVEWSCAFVIPITLRHRSDNLYITAFVWSLTWNQQSRQFPNSFQAFPSFIIVFIVK